VCCCSTSFDVVVVSMQYGFMVQGDFNFPAGQWKTPIGAKNVIGYGVVVRENIKYKIENSNASNNININNNSDTTSRSIKDDLMNF